MVCTHRRSAEQLSAAQAAAATSTTQAAAALPTAQAAAAKSATQVTAAHNHVQPAGVLVATQLSCRLPYAATHPRPDDLLPCRNVPAPPTRQELSGLMETSPVSRPTCGCKEQPTVSAERSQGTAL